MMPPNNLHPKQSQPSKEDNIGSNRKPSTTTSRPQDQTLKCPRCDSPNTKFCYYNNYSLTQPRHFCKTCRRYWTKGGALRNVPIGGGCRKSKKMKSSSSCLSADSKDSSGSSDMGGGGFKFFPGLSPAMDFNLGGLSFPRLNVNPSPPPTGLYNSQFSSFGDISNSCGPSGSVTSPPCFSLDPSALGFNYPLPSVTTTGFSGAVQEVGGGGGGSVGVGSLNVNTSLASSIESLSCINQDLHWKLQQQRLAMLFGGENNNSNNDDNNNNNSKEEQVKPQPILFQNLEISSKAEGRGCGGAGTSSTKEGGETATEWFFGNSYGQVNANSTNSSSNGNDQNNTTGGTGGGGGWNGVQTGWGDLHQYNAFP